jgi:hypothetical protein
MKLTISYCLQTAKLVPQKKKNIKFGCVHRDFQNMTLFKNNFVMERAKPSLTEPE